MMFKLLLLLFAIWLIIVILKKYQQSLNSPSATESSAQATVKTDEESMVKCAVCGVHQPRNESILSGNLFFCCEEHYRRHQSQSSS